ncbi:hypothetical protein [Desulfonatronum thioautotrophicum]|uniref:hypothetical protein n=1 Tax=Desulfonatronum thioautotrophicum TaxID=617001 RepID=UPI0005EB234B|nr:hypothetical protein [Desulfonatronum thioautotrophicum]
MSSASQQPRSTDSSRTGKHLDRQSSPSAAGVVGHLAFALKALIWGVTVYLLGTTFGASEYWVFALGLFTLSLPVALSGFYSATISQIRRLAFFTQRGWIHALFSRRLLKGLLWVGWALVSSFFLLIQFHTYTRLEWTVFFLTAPVFWAIFQLSRKLIAREMQPFLVTSMALSWARTLTPLVMAPAYVLTLLFLTAPAQYPSLSEAIEARKAHVADMTGSAVVYEVSQYLALYDGAKAYFLGNPPGILGATDASPEVSSEVSSDHTSAIFPGVFPSVFPDALWATALVGLGGLVVFFNACAMLSCLLIPGLEFRRVFGPLTSAQVPPPVPPRRTAAIVAVLTFVALFIYLPAVTSLESLLRSNPELTRELAQARESAEAWVVPRLEQIDEQYFRPGTFDKLREARLQALRTVEASMDRLEQQVDPAFDTLEANVDGYLDWYYSLPGEYARIMNLLIGQIEDYMLRKLKESLLAGEPFKDLETALSQAMAEHDRAMREYQEAAQRIMDENRVTSPEDAHKVNVERRISLDEVLNPSMHTDVIGFHTRIGGSAAAGVVSAAVAKKIAGKVAGKNVFKLAAKSLAKVVAGKTAGTAGGASAGAAVGLAFGGPVGAIAGGVLGAVAVGVSVDKMLLMLESAVSREDFKQEILAAVQEAREEFKAGLRG